MDLIKGWKTNRKKHISIPTIHIVSHDSMGDKMIHIK